MSIQEETRTGTIQAQKKVADQLRSIIEQGRRTVEESRFLHKEIQTVLEQSRLALLASHHLIARVNRRPAGGGGRSISVRRSATRFEYLGARLLHFLLHHCTGATVGSSY
jgi:hypothetical protein